MKVSIIVPIYNVEKEIERCLLSVISQKYKDIELILVNDCTPDDSIGKAKDVLLTHQFAGSVLYVDHFVNRGLSAARNSGIRAATGDYLFFLDSDDALSYEDVISDLMEATVTNSGELNQIVVGNSQKIIGENIIEKGSQKNLSLILNQDVYKAYADGELTVTAWGKLVLHSFLKENDLYFRDGIYHEDELWSFKVYKSADKVRALDLVIYNYYEREGSISFLIKEKNVQDLNIVIEELYLSYLTGDDLNQSYTALKIEKLKRRSLKWMSNFEPDFIEEELIRLSRLKTGLSSRNVKLSLQNGIFFLPISIATKYLQWRWK